MFSCDFEDTNTNPDEMTELEGTWDDFAIGGTFLSMQRMVTIVGTQADDTDIINQYQISYHLSADVWSGYFCQNNNWDSGNNHTNNYLKDSWVSASFKNSYTGIFPSWKKIKDNASLESFPEYYALAQILKISAWHKTTDMFGPIPYKEAGELKVVVPFDSQQEVYKAFFEDLEEAIGVLTEKANQGTQVIPDFDAIYSGNTTKWVKYANSLMLRLAMRVRYADAAMAQKYAEMAVNHPIGIITDKADEAKIGEGAGVLFINNLEKLANQYAESRMGSSIFSYLMGYKDPRLSAYFKPSTNVKGTTTNYGVEAFDGNKYQAVPTGHANGANDYYASFSVVNVKNETPTYWLRASEVYFLRAEGALFGWNMGGDAASLYKQGIEASFDENGIAPNLASAYMASGEKPMNYAIRIGWQYNYSNAAPTEATTEFTGNQEQKLEKIITQKWLALFPNGQEAWSEWRRTGYPKLHKVYYDAGGLGASGVRRMIYPASFYQSENDKKNIEEALEMLGGEDKASTKLWWDAK